MPVRLIGSSRDGGLAGHGIGDFYSGRFGEGNGPGRFDVKVHSEAAAKTSQSRLEVGQGDEGVP